MTRKFFKIDLKKELCFRDKLYKNNDGHKVERHVSLDTTIIHSYNIEK